MPRKPRMSLEERRQRRADRKAAEAQPKVDATDFISARSVPDGKVHVPKIMNADPTILPSKLRLAIEVYVTQDLSHKDKAIESSALRAGLSAPELRAYLRQTAIREIVQKKLDMIDVAMAREIAKARVLGVSFLDAQLVTAVKVAAKSGDSKPIELGYERVGMRRDKNFMTTEQANPQSRPQTYRVLEQTVTRTEQVTQREITASEPVQPTPRQSSVQILDY